jgi:ABC-type oligopeptide transport system substrate-binding subunit/class 3 adenylate cyclase
MRCPDCGHESEAEARFCSQCGASLAAAGQPTRGGIHATPSSPTSHVPPSGIGPSSSAPAGGERKLVTILFTDIVESTRLAASLDPEEWKEVVGGAHRRVSQAVARYGGTIAQLLGDGVLAFFGAPITHEDDPIRAVRAALEIQASVDAYRQDLKGLVNDFQLRIGIHTGNVVVGEIGDQTHREYLALGDPVNLAARLQSAAQPGHTLLSQATAGLVESFFDLDPVSPLSLKGIEQPVPAFDVAGLKPSPASPRGLPGVRTTLIGRDQELSRLQSALSALRLGRGQVVTLTGEAGIGKTRLMQEARALLPTSPAEGGPAIRWLESRALSYGESLSFWAITQLLLSDLGLSDGDPEVRISVALRRRIRTLMGDDSPNIEPYLFALMGLPVDDPAASLIGQLDGETRKHQTLLALTHYIEQISLLAPTVLMLEDAHWLDPSSLEAVEALLPITDRAPLMVALLMRPERQHGSWPLKMKMESEFSHRYTGIYLGPLDPSQSMRLAAQLLAVARSDDRLQQTLLDRAGGNPFYLEELIRDLIERRLIIRGADALQLAEADIDSSIPTTLQGLLSGRIDRLPEADRRILQLASVIGQSFLFRILQAICDDPFLLEPSLASLQRAEFLRQVGGLPEREYAFRHSLTQQAAYQSLLLEQRKGIHLRVGKALERLFPDRRQEFLGLLAHHFELAGAGDKAVTYLLEGGDRARLGEELPEAVGYYRRALPFLTEAQDDQRASQTWLKLGLVHQADFDFKAAHQANEAAFALDRKRTVTPKQTAGIPTSEHRHRGHATLRMAVIGSGNPIVRDPAMASEPLSMNFDAQLFAGLTEMDSETNVVPHVARSWEVLDQGRRYIFHLRDDAHWSDGRPVTASDFEWSWRRNLAPETNVFLAHLLDPIAGAKDFRTGRNPDPHSIGVRAVDPTTLEVSLETPIAYFLYITAQPIAYPLPRHAIESCGAHWTEPEHIVSNGAFRLANFGEGLATLTRNPDYFAEFPGNLEQIEWSIGLDVASGLEALSAGRLDLLIAVQPKSIPGAFPPECIQPCPEFSTMALMLRPTRPPLNRLPVRQALALALDHARFAEATVGPGFTPATGGLIPPGMAGHSPNLSMAYDPRLARRLLAEAGFPDGKGFPPLMLSHWGAWLTPSAAWVAQQWQDRLGIPTKLHIVELSADSMEAQPLEAAVVLRGWLADYPDPYSFLGQSNFIFALEGAGWKDADYETLVEGAAQIPDRARRMEMYREADRRLVAEQVLAIPLRYGPSALDLVMPWVHGYHGNAMRLTRLKEVSIERH